MIKRILCAIDVSQLDNDVEVLKRACELRDIYGSVLSVMSVIPDYHMSLVGSYFEEDMMEKTVEETNRLLHNFVEEHVLDSDSVQQIVEIGTPYVKILEVIERVGADLIVMGAHKPDLIDKIQGPNSSRVASYSKISVYIVRH